VRSTQAVNELFNSLFDFSGLSDDATEVDWQQVNLAELLADLGDQYAPLAHERGLQLRLRDGTCTVRSDPVLLKRLFGNLISNALKNTPTERVTRASGTNAFQAAARQRVLDRRQLI